MLRGENRSERRATTNYFLVDFFFEEVEVVFLAVAVSAVAAVVPFLTEIFLVAAAVEEEAEADEVDDNLRFLDEVVTGATAVLDVLRFLLAELTAMAAEGEEADFLLLLEFLFLIVFFLLVIGDSAGVGSTSDFSGFGG